MAPVRAHVCLKGAVVALLRDVGTTAQLTTLLDGEALLSDGASIVLFNVFFQAMTAHTASTAAAAAATTDDLHSTLVGEQDSTNTTARDQADGATLAATPLFLYFLRVALGGPAVGVVAAKLALFWLNAVFDDPLVEVTLTLGSAYVTYYVAEAVCGVSGVLAVCALGYLLGEYRASLVPEVDVFLRRSVRFRQGRVPRGLG